MFWPFKVVKCFVAKTGASSERSRYLIEHIMAAKDKLSTVDFLLWQLLYVLCIQFMQSHIRLNTNIRLDEYIIRQ